MNTYQVGFYYTEYGKKIVKAESEKKAMEMVVAKLSEHGLEGIEYDSSDREYEATFADKID